MWSQMMTFSMMVCRLWKGSWLRWTVLGLLCICMCGLTLHGLHYVLFLTPVPVYILDKLNLRRFSLPNLVCDQCNNFDYDYIIENKDMCGDGDVFLLIFVASFHANANARNMARKTWGGVNVYKGFNIKTVFVFGTHPDKNLNHQTHYEQERHGDIIQANFLDSYIFLSNKSSLALKWATTNCPQAKYILKTDDDSFNIPQNFIDYLIHVNVRKFIGGYCFTVMPDRREGSKFHVTEEQYPDKYYPTYCAGPGYVLSQDAARDIVAVTHNTKFIPMEDVFITGMCRVISGIQYTEIPGVVVGQDQMTPCNLARWVKNGHNIVPGMTEIIWKRLLAGDPNTDCADRNMILYIIILMFILLWCRFLYSLHSPKSRSLRNFVLKRCPIG